VAVRGQDGDVAGEEAEPVDAAFEVAVARPRREDDLVSVDDLLPAAFELAAAGDVVGVGGEAFGDGRRVEPTVDPDTGRTAVAPLSQTTVYEGPRRAAAGPRVPAGRGLTQSHHMINATQHYQRVGFR
jgi:hypothetical protein